jgi:carbon monoxide dehydrogenase subunit G
MPIDIQSSQRLESSSVDVIRMVSDLATYGEWVTLIESAALIADDTWSVDLAADLGPFRRSKRLRIQRTSPPASASVTFERNEIDGRRHASWKMIVDVTPSGSGSEVSVRLHYSGRIWLGPLERLVTDEIAASARRLDAAISERAGR